MLHQIKDVTLTFDIFFEISATKKIFYEKQIKDICCGKPGNVPYFKDLSLCYFAEKVTEKINWWKFLSQQYSTYFHDWVVRGNY